jgi:alkylation response protein AidB-like acyl-CoA dehydrogenase
MDLLLWIVALIAVLGLGFSGASSWVWTGTSGAVLCLLTVNNVLSWPLLIFFWPIWVVTVLFCHVSAWRVRFFTKPIARFVKKQLPPISDTEQAAIDAGDIWWDAALMRGTQSWDDIAAFDVQKLTIEELAFLNQQVDALCKLVDKWMQDNSRQHSEAVWAYIKREKFFSMIIPKQYGGLGFSAYAQSCILSKIATKDISTAVTVMVPNSLGPAELLLHYGTPEQQSFYLPRLADGTDIPCFALTSPDAGSDAGGMIDQGIIMEGMHEGKTVLGISLTFNKRYITLAPVATVVGLAFKCFDPKHLIGDRVECGITVCLLPSSHPGLMIGDRHYPIGGAFPNGSVQGKEVFIPIDWVVGGQAFVGQGWRMLMECLAAGRGISLPALASASAKLADLSTACYGRVRQQFRVSIGAFEGIQSGMAEIGGIAYLLEAMRTITSSAISSGIKPAVVSAIAKYHMTELARVAMTHAMDIHAGKGIMLGPKNYLANTYVSMPVAITVEGANILTRNLIIFGQGAIRCHLYLLKEMNMAAAPVLDVKAFDRVLRDHVHFGIERFFKTLVLGLLAGHGSHTSSKLGFKKTQQAVSRMSDALAFVSDITFLLLGGQLKRKEYLSARLGDVLSYLYMTTCVIKYASTIENDSPKAATFAMAYCLNKIQMAFDAFFDNFPIKWIGKLLRFIVFPFGRSYRYPSDQLSSEVAKEMMGSSFKEPMWESFYVGDDHDNLGVVRAAAELDAAMHEQIRAVRHLRLDSVLPQTFRDKLAAAVEAGTVSESDHQHLLRYCDLVEKSIAVDTFST